MLYTLLLANLLAVVFGYESHCNNFGNATACLANGECGWTISKSESCGWCIDPEYKCVDAAKFQCNLKCQLNDVPSYARDSCGNKDNLNCDSQCQSYITVCYANATCAAISDTTISAEEEFSQAAGCDSEDEGEKQRCKDKNQVFAKALNVSLQAYCWGDAHTSNADACNLYKAAVNCHATNCSDDCDDCSVACRDSYVDCLFDEDCSVALFWLTNEIKNYVDKDDIFFPYKLKVDKEEYCADSKTSQYCNSLFDAVWTCLVDSCLERGCPYSQCNAKFQACYEDTECQNQLFAVVKKYPLDQTPGVTGALINYFCQKDQDLNCTNSNFLTLVECYSGKCCWDPEVCVGADQLEGCNDPDCLEEACVEVKCLPEFRNCMNDVNCGDAFILQIQWSEYCEECMDKGENATTCSNNPANLDCSVLEDSDAILYIQYYCWNNPSKCDEDVSNLLHCVVQNCADCDDKEDEDENGEDENGEDENNEDEDDDAMCTCVFGTCWESVEACFFDEHCWKLLFSDSKDGYGFEAMMKAVTEDLNETILLVPTLVDTRIRERYCNNKNCTENFWDLWYCVWPPIYMGDSYSCSSYWNDITSGCGLSNALYQHYPECLTTECMGFADDCLGNLSSPCATTYEAAMSKGELFLCEFCDTSDCDQDCQDECHQYCIEPSTLNSSYISRCGTTGSQCPQEYRNFANCLYRKCGGKSNTLPGAQEGKNIDCPTNGVVMQTGILALILSMVLVVFTL